MAGWLIVASRDDVRLITKVARLYYESDLNQPEIARRLGISQAKVSRLLGQARERDIVRISVEPPLGVHTDLEEAIETGFGIAEAVVVDASDDDGRLRRDLGRAAASYLEATLRSEDVIGISSWSDSLLATVDAMSPVTSGRGIRVVQILGGVGDPVAERHATELARRLSNLVGGSATLLPVPGVVGSAEARDVLVRDEHVRRALDLLPTITVALVGIGTIEPSPLLRSSGNVFAPDELATVERAGGVGDICLRFFDAAGRPVAGPLDRRVVGIDLAELRRVPRTVAVAGGRRKHAAIEAALRGGLVTHLVTDRATARALIG